MKIEKVVSEKKLVCDTTGGLRMYVKSPNSLVLKALQLYNIQEKVFNLDFSISLCMEHIQAIKYVHRESAVEDYRLN
jgi:hypothetical protein